MSCQHEGSTHLNKRGEIVCRKCGAIYEIGLAGCRWIEPKRGKPAAG